MRYPRAMSKALPLVLLLAVAMGCSSVPVYETVGGLRGPARIHGDVVIPPGVASPEHTRGTLVVGWFTPDEAAARATGQRTRGLLFALLPRLRVVGTVDISAGRVPYALPHPGGDAVPFAIFDPGQDFWALLFGGGREPGGLFGVAADTAHVHGETASRVDIGLALPRRTPRRRWCEGERVEEVTLEAPEVAGSIGNETRRKSCVYLPPSYATSDSRYPVVYLLPGITGTHESYFRVPFMRSIADELDTRGRGIILVGVDTSTRTGSTYLVDSPVTGRWERFLVDRLVPFIDGRYRTRSAAGGRALAGHSTGGFNALSYVLRYPAVFGAAAGTSPDALDLEPWLLGPDGAARRRWQTWIRLEQGVGPPGQLSSYAADWSFDESGVGAGRGFWWPIDLETGAAIPEVMARWSAAGPMRLLEDPRVLARARELLSGRLLVGPSRQDEFGLYPPAERFHERLTALGIEHVWDPVVGGHSADFEGRYRRVFAFLSERLYPPESARGE